MEKGYLKDYFEHIISKELSEVEISRISSNQHEFNATKEMKAVFGTKRKDIITEFLYINKENSESQVSSLTWYDARESHPRRSEYRLYYPAIAFFENIKIGGMLFLCLKKDKTVLCIIASDTETVSIIQWLLGDGDNCKGYDPEKEPLVTSIENCILKHLEFEIAYRDLGLFISEVTIHNFKGIKELEIQFDKGVNIIMGDNGVGKTSIMEALALSFGGLLSGIKGIKRQGIQQNDIRCSLSGGLHFLGKTSIDTELECADGSKYNWRIYREDELEKTKYLNERQIADYMKQRKNTGYTGETLIPMLPVLCYLGTDRIYSKQINSKSSSAKTFSDRALGYESCQKSETEMEAIEDWCLRMEMMSFRNEGRSNKSYSWFLDTIETFLEDIDSENKNLEVYYSREIERLAIRTEKEDIPISLLSAGYQSLLHIVMDIAYRIALLNPNSFEYEKATGIVVIDEVDMHLHPKWQWNVVRALRNVFPNVQFIMATHSPIIISSCNNGRLISIDEKQEVTYLESNYAYSIQDVVEYAQGSLSIPYELRQLADQFDRAYGANDRKSAEAAIEKMSNLYGEDNTEVVRALRKMRIWRKKG